MLQFQPTPNPNARRCELPPELDASPPAGVSMRSYRSLEQAQVDPLARAIFSAPGVCGVLIGDGWATVSKTPDARWGDVESAVGRILRESAGR